ncbi:facilitated trehalose transporter Tret1-like [Phymastichus coffea]|uniref:facilitated trehalose transporter Tret1-like n=1 Tax=Phymastichus coffea TaxID=108790 RepID=UPI00273C9748|nr:facilitated trehalose transporter Tret1-like [Phymastichus coffea]
MVQRDGTNLKIEVKNKLFTQCIATAGVMVLIIQTGIMGGWTSPNMARLTSENSTIPITLSEASWVASCLNLGRFVSVVLVPIFIELAGSKKTILLSFLPVTASWIVCMIANSAMMLYTARFLCGITYGLTYGCFSMYLGEVSVAAYRGTFVSIAMIGWPLGSVIGTIAETYLPMAVSSSIYLAQCLAGIMILIWLPDSPYQLVKNKQLDRARESLAWYRGHSNTEQEMDKILEFIESNAKQTFGERMQQLGSKPVRRAVFIVVIIFAFPQLVGLFNVFYYMELILTNGKSFLVEPSEFVIYANLVLFASTVATANLIDKLGRRVLLMASGLGVTVALAGLGLHYFLLGNARVDPVSMQWLPVASIVLFVITYTVGFLTVPSTVLGEMFPANIKSTAAGFTSLTSALLGFLASKAYQPMVDAIGEAYVFWIHALFSALAVPVALFLLPETKGKSFQEIQIDLHKK